MPVTVTPPGGPNIFKAYRITPAADAATTTQEIQGVFDSLRYYNSVIFAPGEYLLNGPLYIRNTASHLYSVKIAAEHENTVIIRQTQSQPIFVFEHAGTTTPSNYEFHSFLIRGLLFVWSSRQTSPPASGALPSAGIYFTSHAGSTSPEHGFYRFSIEECRFLDGYYGISTNANGKIAYWGSSINRCYFTDNTGSAIRVMVIAGATHNNISNCFVNNPNTTNKESPFNLVAYSGTIINVDMEDTEAYPLISLAGGGNLTINCLFAERYTHSALHPWIIWTEGVHLDISGLFLHGTINAGNYAGVLRAWNSYIYVSDVTMDIDLPGGNLYLFSGGQDDNAFRLVGRMKLSSRSSAKTSTTPPITVESATQSLTKVL